MAYEVLTNKYRPRRLEDLVGQENAVDIIRGMLEGGRISRTNLISGPYGSGKTTVARLLSMYVNCQAEDRKLSDPPCGKCPGCKDVLGSSGRDYMEINAADSRGIDAIRAVIDAAQYKAAGNYRIFVFDECHQITQAGMEALLKILEEPPGESIFLLCTTNPQKLPATLSSRCQKINIVPVAPSKCQEVLARVVKGEEWDTEVFTSDVLLKIAIAVEGHPRDALMTLEAMQNQLKSKGKIEDPEKFILDKADELAGTNVDKIVPELLMGVYSGKVTFAILSMWDLLSEPMKFNDFLAKILDYHVTTLYWRLSPKLKDKNKMMFAWYAKLDEKFGKTPPPINVFVEVLDLFNDTMGKFKRYEGTDNYYSLVSVVTKAASIFKAAERAEEPKA